MQFAKGITAGEFKRREAAARRAWKADKKSAIVVGRALMAVRQALKLKRTFTKWLGKNRIDRNRAYYCMGEVNGSRKKRTQRRVEKLSPRERTLRPFIEELRTLYTLSETGEIPQMAEAAHKLIAHIKKYFLGQETVRVVVPLKAKAAKA